jgi:hypothetical protein
MADTVSEGIHFQPDTHLIAIGKNDNGRHIYILLSSAENDGNQNILIANIEKV